MEPVSSRRAVLAALGAGSAALAAGRYVDAFLANVLWDEVSRRTEWAQKARRT